MKKTGALLFFGFGRDMASNRGRASSWYFNFFLKKDGVDLEKEATIQVHAE